MKKRKKIVILLVSLTILVIIAPLIIHKGAGFTGSDIAGSEMINEVSGGEYEPWFNPVLETIIGGELPGEMETFFFCIQTGIGVGIIAYCFGYLAAKKKYAGDIEVQKRVSAKKS